MSEASSPPSSRPAASPYSPNRDKTMERREAAAAELPPMPAPIWSRVIPHTSKADVHGDIRRCWDPESHPELGLLGCRTIYECFRRGYQLNPLGACLGFRATSTSGFATPYIYSSYTECLARIDALAAGMDQLQLLSQPNSTNLKVLAVYLPNCMEWILAEQAVYAIGACVAPLYDTLGPDTVQFIVQQTECTTVLSTRRSLKKLCQAKLEQQQQQQLENENGDYCPNFKTVILIDGVTPEAVELAKEANLEVISFAKVEAVGAELLSASGKRHEHTPPSPTDVATFCYTSGTTGPPKGALLTHQNILSGLSGLLAANPELEGHSYDRHLSFLPLAHIMERMICISCMVAGASIAFYRGDPLLLVEDWQACRPTMVVAAPRVLNKIYDKIQAGISAAGGMKKRLFDAAVATKLHNLHTEGQLHHSIYDRLLFRKITANLGLDHVRLLTSGSAPLSETVMSFFRILLSAPVIEGYGQTEGCGTATISHANDTMTVGHVGGPSASLEMALFDVPDMGYTQYGRWHGTDNNNNSKAQPCFGRGEICYRGPNVFLGYYKNEEATKEMIDADGWLHSGDIGLWRPDGSLQIIDRKKNLFKLSQGEYVAPEKIENILMRSPLIGMCFVHGDSLQSSLVAIVVPDELPVKQWWENTGMASSSFEEMCQSSELKSAILKEIQTLSKDAGLKGFEMVKAIHIEPQPFTVEAGFLTPTFKLKRQSCRDAYVKVIDALYQELNSKRLASKL